jgi:4-hydroxy-tetrahydrodipicolinate synthase
MSQTGIDALVLVTNHLDPRNEGSEFFFATLQSLLAVLPVSMPLGLYECPAPYRRLLSDDEFAWCANSGRFVVLKDVSCDLPTVERRVRLAQGTPLKVINANAAIAWPAMLAGAEGFSGVFTNFHPELYSWLWREGKTSGRWPTSWRYSCRWERSPKHWATRRTPKFTISGWGPSTVLPAGLTKTMY